MENSKASVVFPRLFTLRLLSLLNFALLDSGQWLFEVLFLPTISRLCCLLCSFVISFYFILYTNFALLHVTHFMYGLLNLLPFLTSLFFKTMFDVVDMRLSHSLGYVYGCVCICVCVYACQCPH
jgi:hypothetical protein